MYLNLIVVTIYTSGANVHYGPAEYGDCGSTQ